MHQYLRAIGFSNIKSKKEYNNLVNDWIINSTLKNKINIDDTSEYLCEYNKKYSNLTGITLVRKIDEEEDNNESKIIDYYFPYVKPFQVSTNVRFSLDRHVQNDSLIGCCDDYRVGIPLIFNIQNGIDITKKIDIIKEKIDTSISFTALSNEGFIMLPIKKNAVEVDKVNKIYTEKRKHIIAANQGDESAIEKLMIQEYDTITMVNEKIQTDDVYTLVDSFFRPYSLDSEKYLILGDIKEVEVEKNYLTEEELYIMAVSVCGLVITVCINKKDILGEPQVGRRFKGEIWLSGVINF